RLVRVFALSFGRYRYRYRYRQSRDKVAWCNHKIYSDSLTFKRLPAISQFIQAYRLSLRARLTAPTGRSEVVKLPDWGRKRRSQTLAQHF
ncbi:MAG: hypothetical protein ABF471_12000, partial [Acetobacter orientalis]